MRKIDVFTHIIPPDYRARAESILRGLGAASRVDAFAHITPSQDSEDDSVSDLDARFRSLERLDDYAQVLSLATPPVSDFGVPDISRELARLANDGMAALVGDYPDSFVAFVASLPHTSPDDDLAELERAVGELGAAGIQLHSNVGGVPLDDDAFVPILERMNELGKPIWLHPTRSDQWSDYPHEERSKYDIWWSLGWPYETSVAMARLVFSGRLEQFPGLRIITHHAGAMVAPMSGRLAVPAFGPDARQISGKPLDHFRRFYADTAAFGAPHSVRCSLEFFGAEHMLFGTDSPLGGSGTESMSRGEAVVRGTMRDIESLELPRRDLELIYHGNAERILGLGGA
jgi:uncharacterized protein